ncbi:MAG: zinc ribbon domain-containing protein [Chlamydiales bacterium]
MPTYEYLCQKCQHKLEAFQKISEQPLSTCPVCQQNTLKRGLGGGSGILFKGTGFYITDYAAKSSTKECSQEPSSSCNKTQ